MRTKTIVKKFRSTQNWLKWYFISRKKILNSYEAAIYLKISPAYIYRLVNRYALPCFKTKNRTYCFRKKEIDEWQKSRGKRSRGTEIKTHQTAVDNSKKS